MNFVGHLNGVFRGFSLNDENFKIFERKFGHDPNILQQTLKKIGLSGFQIVRMTPTSEFCKKSRLLRLVDCVLANQYNQASKTMKLMKITTETPIIKNAVKKGDSVLDSSVDIPVLIKIVGKPISNNTTPRPTVGHSSKSESNSSHHEKDTPVTSFHSFGTSKSTQHSAPQSTSHYDVPDDAEDGFYSRETMTLLQSIHDTEDMETEGDIPATETSQSFDPASSTSAPTDTSAPIKWTETKTTLFLHAIKKYKEKHKDQLMLQKMYDVVARQMMKDNIFEAISSDQVKNKYRRLQRSYKEHQSSTGVKQKDLDFEEELHELFGSREDLRPIKTNNEFSEGEIIDSDPLESEEEFVVRHKTKDTETDTSAIKWTKTQTSLFLQAIKKYRAEHEGRLVLKQMYDVVASQMTRDKIFEVLFSYQVSNKYRRLQRSYKEHIEFESVMGAKQKDLDFEEELHELFGSRDDLRSKKTKNEFPQVEMIDPDALEPEEQFEVPNAGGFKSFCCGTYFGNLEVLLEHMKRHHYAVLRTSILSKRDLVLECFEVIEEDFLELEPKVEIEEPDDFEEERTPVKPKIQNTKRKPTTWEEESFEITVPKRNRVKKKPEPEDTRKFECTKCKKVCIGLRSLQNHKQKHIGFYYCDMCAACFFTKAKLQTHIFKHQLEKVENKTLVCMMCEIIFDNEALVEAHIQEFHILSPNGFQCESCPEKLTTKFNLINHVRHYHQRKKISCQYCYKTFETKEDMKRHSMKQHPGTSSDILCTLCGKYFKGQHRFKKHQHSTDKPLIAFCSVCKKGFATARSCQIHEMNVHGVGEAFFTCGTCKKGFATLGDLKNHEVNHSDATPFLCAECPMAFKRKSHLTSHIETHHSVGYAVPCLICSKEFKGKTNLRSHLRKVHKITMNEMYKHAGIPYKGRDLTWSKFLQNRKEKDINI